MSVFLLLTYQTDVIGMSVKLPQINIKKLAGLGF